MNLIQALGVAATLMLAGCTETSREQGTPELERSPQSKTAAAVPFTLPADLKGFLLLWFDDTGVHSARTLDEVPESARKVVRVRPLNPELEDKLDPLAVYVADLSVPASGSTRPVRTMRRLEFDALVDRASGAAHEAASSGPIIVYRTSWCGVCQKAVAWLRENGHAYVEKDVEKDAAAAQEVQKKLSAAGKTSRGVPVIDVGGKLMVGFDADQLARLITGS